MRLWCILLMFLPLLGEAIMAIRTGGTGRTGIQGFQAASPYGEDEKLRSNARSPRYSTGRAVGFVSGPGITPATQPASDASGGEMARPKIPQAPGLGTTLAGAGLAYGARNALSGGGVPVESRAPVSERSPTGLGYNENTDVESTLGGAAESYNPWASDIVSNDLVSGGFDVSSPDIVWDDLASGGFDTAGGAAADAAGGSVPIVGPALRLAQGDVGGAAGSFAGGMIGNALLPGIGGPIGGAVGGLVGGNCFITEAVMSAGGEDGGPDLETLRQFRDQFLMTNPMGQALVQEYDALAPVVVEAISARPDALDIFQQIKAQYIDQAVQAIQQGDMQGALEIYASMISDVTQIAIQSQAGPGGEADDRVAPGQEDIDEFGSHAAMVANNPEMQNAAMGPGAGAMPPQSMQPGMPSAEPEQASSQIGSIFARRPMMGQGVMGRGGY